MKATKVIAMQDANNELDILRFAIQAVDGFVWLWEPNTDQLTFYGDTKETLGPGDQPLKGALWGARLHPTEHLKARQILIDLLKGRVNNINKTFRVKKSDGNWSWIHTEASVYEYEPNGRVKNIIGYIQSVDQQKAQAIKTRQHDEQMSLALHSTQSTLFDYNIAHQTFNLVSFKTENDKVIRHDRTGKIQNGLDTVHPDDYANNLAFFDAFSNNEVGTIKATWRSNYLNKGYRWQKAQGQIVEHDDQGNPIRAIGIRQDIHDIYTLELQTKIDDERDYQALKGTLHATWNWNLETDFFQINANVKEQLIEDINDWQETMKFWWALVHPDDKQRISNDIQQQIESGQNQLNTEYRVTRNNGQIAWLTSTGTITKRSDKNEPMEAFGVVIDITPQKEVEMALKQEKQLAQITLESINEAVITTDQDGLITSLNRKAEKLLSTDKQAAIGLTLATLCSLNDEHSEQEAQDPIALCISTNMSFSLNHLTLTNNQQISAHIDCSISPLHSTDHELIGCVMIIRDISHSKQMTSEMEHRAQHDALTDLYNRHAFEKALAKSTSTESYQHILCYLDLDQFKIINDTCGHTAGDELLRQLSAELIKGVRKTDTLARLGGDEFGILIHDCDIDEAFKIATKIKSTIVEHTFHWEDKTFRLGVSIGLSTINPSTSPTQAMQHADAACFSAKEQGRNRIHVYRPDDDEMTLTNGQMGWVPRIQKALQENYFELHAQAIIELQDDAQSPTHFEILIRLNESGEVIPPGAFLPAAERYNLSSHLDKWVIENTLHTLNKFKHKIHTDDVFNINLSAASLTEHGFLAFIQETFKVADTRPSQICFEITETAAVTNLTAANSFITSLKEMGCQFALDDFGSGLSSFGYLKNFPVDYLKIDGSFVKDITTDPIDAAMVKSINEIGQIMGKKTVAEWVENQTTADMLKEIGVDFAQGYHYSKPTELNKLLTER